MRNRIAALTGAMLAGAVVSTPWEAPAVADEPGFSVRVEAPDAFTAGKNTRTVTAVVTSQNRQCRKVRWALLVHTGIAPEQIEVTRIEEEREFPVSSSTVEITTRFLDDRLDPGLLCRGRTVTGRWEIAFDGPDAGGVQFEAQAFDVRDRLLSAGGAGAEVESGEPVAEDPSEEAAPPAAEEPEEDPGETGAPPAAAGNDGADERQGADTALASQESSLLGTGLIVGGVFVFLGLLLLLRIRARARQARESAEVLPTGFYTMPGTPR